MNLTCEIDYDSEINNTSKSFENMSVSSEKSCYGFQPGAESSKLSDCVACASTSFEKNPSGFELVEIILKNCVPDLSSYLDKCKKAKICNASINNLTRDDVNALFFEEVGLRGIFMVELGKHQAKNKMADKCMTRFDDCDTRELEKQIDDQVLTYENRVVNFNSFNKRDCNSKFYKKFANWKKVVRNLDILVKTEFKCILFSQYQ